ncbi:MAG: flagellar hook-associated protein FlgK [Rhodospirillales bacterium]|nr:flagellar hook-associated protein FlgK [Rhodospirillales bacterium]
MGTLTLALRTAQSGLLANQQALDVTSRNISNVNTEGYSRKVVTFENSSLVGAGTGVNISEIMRSVDEGLLKSFRIESSELNALSSQNTFWDRLQDLFGSPEANTSLSHTISAFSEAIESVVVSPNNALEHTEAVRRAEDMLQQMQQMSIAIQELRLQADQKLSDVATEINSLVGEIDTLNDDIIASGSVSRETSDLKDQRDLKLSRLSELIDIRYFSRTDGDVVVFTSSGRTLVDTVPPEVTHTSASAVTPTTTHSEGDFSGFFIGSSENPANDATEDIRDGQAKGLIDMRDSVLPNLQSQIDELAANLRDVINQVHNRGVSFPGATEYNGTRNFTEPTTQLIKLDPTNSADDVTIVLFDSSGNESEHTTLNSIMTNAGFSSRGSGDDWHISDIASTLQSWLRNNGASDATVDTSSGQFDISLNTTSLGLAFRDQTATADGSSSEDAEIAYDSNGDGVIDETVSGFSYFFGLNDFFVDNLADNVWESDVLASTYTASASTLTFRDATGSIGSLTIAAGTSLEDIVTQVSNDSTLSQNVTAAVVPDGSGYRLRFSHNSGSSMQITQASGNTFLSDAGIDIADVRISSTLTVRTDIKNTPSKMSVGAPQWDSTLGVAGEYLMSVADETVAEQIAEALNSTTSFDVSGGMPTASLTFAERAAAIVSTNATLANTHDRNESAQRSLTESLELQFESERGVNLDEEMSNLIIFEQAFASSARIITTIQRMFDALERVL